MARILVAEDDGISQQVVRAALQTAGFAVDIVEDGAEAISAVQARVYDLVLMEIQGRTTSLRFTQGNTRLRQQSTNWSMLGVG